jgi:acyl carrier protein
VWLVNLLAAELAVETEQLDINQPVTRYGIDSLRAIELTHLIEAALDVSLSMTTLLQGQSIAELAALLYSKLTEDSPASPTETGLSRSTSDTARSHTASVRSGFFNNLRRRARLTTWPVQSVFVKSWMLLLSATLFKSW